MERSLWTAGDGVYECPGRQESVNYGRDDTRQLAVALHPIPGAQNFYSLSVISVTLACPIDPHVLSTPGGASQRGQTMQTIEKGRFFGTSTSFSVVGAFAVWAAIIGLIAII
jgi:hypothetical protein